MSRARESPGMRFIQALPVLAALAVGSQGGEFKDGTQADASPPECKNVPGDPEWPSDLSWKALNATTGGKLTKTAPVAESCYDGPFSNKDLGKCARVAKMWSDQDFQTSNPVGRPYPYNITCAPVDYAAAAAKKLAPDTGGYTIEGDRHDPDYVPDNRHDPLGVFYRPSCVGAEAFVERPDGRLCRV
ncbi:hypothetical protein LX32DRAFT_727841 [Colletotrichum zoysiae]|uniref:Secreted protein n=1 Tax=Colletotrichum zoysiae TaxID=1216348 RepID=A0AAD9M0Q1_9PEZI|nr:hypothetical protein LX32DRAFT_727841 [Colletotrichum zoysiae]